MWRMTAPSSRKKVCGQAVLSKAAGDLAVGIDCPSGLCETRIRLEEFANLSGFIHGDDQGANAIPEFLLVRPQVIEIFPARNTPRGENSTTVTCPESQVRSTSFPSSVASENAGASSPILGEALAARRKNSEMARNTEAS